SISMRHLTIIYSILSSIKTSPSLFGSLTVKKRRRSRPERLSVLSNPRIRCQACASVLTNSNIRSAPMLGLPTLQGFSITLN
ncbi:hypothetical protein, partial [Bacillus paralicheniformis]|uniref:hypothetical protein n=1 Tax=Bacillus paralicheniformis TaxID=1648923 RepID=UPI002DBEFEFB